MGQVWVEDLLFHLLAVGLSFAFRMDGKEKILNLRFYDWKVCAAYHKLTGPLIISVSRLQTELMFTGVSLQHWFN